MMKSQNLTLWPAQSASADCVWVDAAIVAALAERGDAVNDRVHKSASTKLQSALDGWLGPEAQFSC
jgi:hypothetical protein